MAMRWGGVVLFSMILLLGITAPWIAPFDPNAVVCNPFDAPSSQYWLGCNDVGQDLFSRLLHGTKISVYSGVLVAVCVTVIAMLTALYAGYRRGWVDQLLMRVVDLFLALPFLPLVILLGVYFTEASHSRIWVLIIAMWPLPVRELRAQVLVQRESGYVIASKAMGASTWQVIRWHLLPGLVPLLVPQFVRVAHNAILLESSLAFLGLGDPQQLSWGSMLFQANARTAFLTDAWQWWVASPGIAIALTVTALAFIGFGFRPHRITNGVPKTRSKPTIAAKNACLPKGDNIVQVTELEVAYTPQERILRHLMLALKPHQFSVLVGTSGCGKSTLAHALLGLLPDHATCQFKQLVITDHVVTGDERDWQLLRGRRIAFIPQNAMTALNPVTTIGTQLSSALQRCGVVAPQDLETRAIALLAQVGLSKTQLTQYPHQLSGGMRQRVVMAIALSQQPDILIADEPTTGLDLLTQQSVLRQLKALQQSQDLTVLLITHSTAIAQRYSDRTLVMDKGQLIFDGTAEAARESHNPQVSQLFRAELTMAEPKQWARAGIVSTVQPLLSVSGAVKRFATGYRWWSTLGEKTVLDNVALALYPGEVVGLVGASGSGKSTLANVLTTQLPLDDGQLCIAGQDWQDLTPQARDAYQRRVHMIFQDPYSAMRSDWTVARVLQEPRLIQGEALLSAEALVEALSVVKLPRPDSWLDRPMRSLSGGQRQRIAFARALLSGADIIIADEPSSMLDQSVQRDVLDALEAIRRQRQISLLFITHDIALANHFCDRLVVMDQGRTMANDRRLPYVQQLMNAAT